MRLFPIIVLFLFTSCFNDSSPRTTVPFEGSNDPKNECIISNLYDPFNQIISTYFNKDSSFSTQPAKLTQDKIELFCRANDNEKSIWLIGLNGNGQYDSTLLFYEDYVEYFSKTNSNLDTSSCKIIINTYSLNQDTEQYDKTEQIISF